MKRITGIGVVVVLFFLLMGCSSSNKAARLATRNDKVELRLPSDEKTKAPESTTVTVRSKSVAERNGKIDLGFEVAVPNVMLDNQWEMQLTPELYYISDSETVLDSAYLAKINLTGEKLNALRMSARESSDRILKELADSGKYYNGGHVLEVFVERNMPEIYSLKYDTTYVYTKEDSSKVVSELSNWYSVTDQEAIDHYSNQCALKKLRRNKHLLGTQSDGETPARIDTVFRRENGDFVCRYVETVSSRPQLKKIYVYVAGNIYDDNGQCVYRVPRTDSLVFTLSSVGQLYKEKNRYLQRVVNRIAEFKSSFKIGFEAWKSEINPDLFDNAKEVKQIEQTILKVLQGREFDLDSVIVTAHCSPEGRYQANSMLSRKRSQSVSVYFDAYMDRVVDSLNAEQGASVDESGNVQKGRTVEKIQFRSRSEAENWPQMNDLIRTDTTLTEEMRQLYFKDVMPVANLDVREERLKALPYYNYVKSSLFPKLRTVEFNFHIHRRGMIKDTIMTTEVDSAYAKGLAYLKDCDYEHAVEILGNYPDDYNLAVCYAALDRNESALDILEPMKRTVEVNYLLALLYSRQGDNKKAVQCYLDACQQDASYRQRGKLDPEIAILIKTYDLNAGASE